MSMFYCDAPLDPGATLTLPPAAAHHAHVRRVAVGDAVTLTNGVGRIAQACVTGAGRSTMEVAVGECRTVGRPAPLVLLAPVGDRERMLWLAEKATELGATEWRPVMFQRSRSVSPRGEGASFAVKLRARMVGALEQSGGAWLPAIFPEVPADDAVHLEGMAARYLLDPAGEPISAASAATGAAIALGPEGGLEPDERARFVACGWRPSAIAATILRFETAAIAAMAVLRAAHLTTATTGSVHG